MVNLLFKQTRKKMFRQSDQTRIFPYFCVVDVYLHRDFDSGVIY